MMRQQKSLIVKLAPLIGKYLGKYLVGLTLPLVFVYKAAAVTVKVVC